MSRLVVAVALLGAIGIGVPALADEPQPPSQSQQAGQRDARWLRAGIREYQRYNDKVADQTLPETIRGVETVFYIRGVLDDMWTAAFKARLEEAVINTSKNSPDPKLKVNPKLLEGIHGSDGYFAPLWKTDFVDSTFQIDQFVQIVSNYIDAHPEAWDKHAQDIIGDAMVAAFPAKTQ